MTCELTGGRYLLMIIDYSTFYSFKYCNGGLLRNFSFLLFFFSFSLGVSRERGIRASVFCNLVSLDHLGVKTTFKLDAAFIAKSVASLISRQIQTQLHRVRVEPNIFLFFM